MGMDLQKRPRGLPKLVAQRTGLSASYVRYVLNGQVPNNSVNTALIHKVAREIMAELLLNA